MLIGPERFTTSSQPLSVLARAGGKFHFGGQAEPYSHIVSPFQGLIGSNGFSL
jgi:hypothetical protein